MALSHTMFTVGGTAVALTNHTIFRFPTTVCIQNTSGSANLYLGGSNVSTTNYGFRVDPGQAFTADLGGEDVLYGISNGTIPVGVIYLEQR